MLIRNVRKFLLALLGRQFVKLVCSLPAQKRFVVVLGVVHTIEVMIYICQVLATEEIIVQQQKAALL